MNERGSACDVESVDRMVHSFVPMAEMASSTIGGDQTDSVAAPAGPVSFRLPSDSSNKFAELLDGLEKSKQQLGIASVSMSITTMEEVFLK